MADDKTKRGSPDSKRLNKNEPYEMKYAESKRASPQRKAMADGSGARRSGSGAKKGAAKRSSGASKSSGTVKRSSGATKRAGTATRGSGAAKRGSASSAKRTAGKSGAKRTGSSPSRASKSPAKRAGAKSASPAMKRTNAAPSRPQNPTPTRRAKPNPPKAEKTVENTAPQTMREADAVDLLTDDHLAVSALFKQYEKLAKKEAPAEERRSLAQSICDMLKAHTRIEEEIFYPAARGAGIDADLLDEANIEHASAKDLIAQIEIGNPRDDLFDARVTVLGEYIQHHVVEEHTEMFPKCRRAGMDLVALREELEARKLSLLPESASDGANAGANDDSPGLLAKLSDKLFSTDSKADERGGAASPRR